MSLEKQAPVQTQGNDEQLASLEEAFRYQELELQRERENNRQLNDHIMRVQSDQAHKLKEKSGDLKKKSKRLFDMEKSYKRQTQLIESRNRENKQLTDEVATLKARLVEREKVHQ